MPRFYPQNLKHLQQYHRPDREQTENGKFSVFQQDRQLDKQFEEDPTKAIKRVKQLIKQYQQAAETAKQQFESELKSAQADVRFCLPFPSFFFEKSENTLVFCCV